MVLEAQPGREGPVLIDGDLVISESAAICQHVADNNPAPHLMPEVGTPERAKCYPMDQLHPDRAGPTALDNRQAPLCASARASRSRDHGYSALGVLDCRTASGARHLRPGIPCWQCVDGCRYLGGAYASVGKERPPLARERSIGRLPEKSARTGGAAPGTDAGKDADKRYLKQLRKSAIYFFGGSVRTSEI